MIGYVTLGVSDLAKAKAFYTELLEELNAHLLVDMDRIAFFGKDMSNPMLAVCIPYNEQQQSPGNGNMVALNPGSKEACNVLYHKAQALGATCDGEPGQRIPDMFYGAYVRDPDGNKICFFQFG